MVTAYSGPPPAEVLMTRLARCGVIFSLQDGALEVDAPIGVLSDADRRALKVRKTDLLALVAKAEGWGQTPAPVEPDPLNPLDALDGPRRTAWGTLAWSDPDEPALELFGPPSDGVAGPAPEAVPDPDVWSMPVPRKRR